MDADAQLLMVTFTESLGNGRDCKHYFASALLSPAPTASHHEEAKDTLQRAAKENWRPGGPYNANYKDKYLLVHFTIEDEGAFTTPWTATMIYLRDRGEWPEGVCAENRRFHADKDADVPTADKPDF